MALFKALYIWPNETIDRSKQPYLQEQQRCRSKNETIARGFQVGPEGEAWERAITVMGSWPLEATVVQLFVFLVNNL